MAQSDVTPDEAPVPRTEAKPSYRELLTKDVLLFFCGFIAFNICLLAVLSLVSFDFADARNGRESIGFRKHVADDNLGRIFSFLRNAV